MRFIDLTGRRFGRLTVVRRVEDRVTPSGRRIAQWLCYCECGGQCVVQGWNLSRGLTRSCGCYAREQHVKRGQTMNLKHGHNRRKAVSPEYQSWRSMIQRCENPNAYDYARYGGRGITVCERWRSCFENFLADMGPRPSPQHTLDRIDPNRNYEPGNCRWATKAEQSRNVRPRQSNVIGVKGVRKSGRNSYAASISVDGKSVYLGVFPTVEEAIQARRKAEQLYWGGER